MPRSIFKKLQPVLEKFLASDDFKTGVIRSTKAGWGGSCCKVELLPDGTWCVLWKNEIGNLYETPGVLLVLPSIEFDPSERDEIIEGGAAKDEDEFLSMAFENECEELKEDMRTYFSDKAALNGVEV